MNKETAQRILAVAKSLGYAPDPKLAATMAVRSTKKQSLEPIAWLNANQNARAYHDYAWLAPYRHGAAECCAELGYRLEELWLREPGMTKRRISSILQHRGICGVTVCPAVRPEITHLRLDWPHFEHLIRDRRARAAPPPVAPNYHYNIQLALKMLRRPPLAR